MLWSFTYPVLNWLTNCFIFGCQCKITTEVDEISEIYGRLHMWLLKCLLSWSKKVSLVRPNWWLLWTNSLILYFSVVICLLLQKWWINSARTTIETWDSVAYFLPLITTSQQTKDATTHNTEQIRPSLSCPCCTSQIWCLCLHTRSKYSHCVVWTHTIVQRDKVINLVFSFCWRHLFYRTVCTGHEDVCCMKILFLKFLHVFLEYIHWEHSSLFYMHEFFPRRNECNVRLTHSKGKIYRPSVLNWVDPAQNSWHTPEIFSSLCLQKVALTWHRCNFSWTILQ